LTGEKGSGQAVMNRSKQTTMAVKTIVVFLLGLIFASGCGASGASRYRPCHELRTDMSVSNEEFSRRCRTGFSD
jgi:hypothetical protein